MSAEKGNKKSLLKIHVCLDKGEAYEAKLTRRDGHCSNAPAESSNY